MALFIKISFQKCWVLALFIICISLVASSSFQNHRSRDKSLFDQQTQGGKFLSIFNVVRFPNDICAASNTRNGTCFTSEECSSKGGSASGTCASGYGVCCVFVLGCGSMSDVNCTYIEQSAITSASSLAANPCMYTLCKCSSAACRLRLDFMSNVLAPPTTSPAVAIATVALDTVGNSVGDCATDSMTLTVPGRNGAPTLCGFNSGQHMIVDMTDAGCNVLSFNLGTSVTTSRQWNIKVTQFTCNDENGNGGPPGCLQYHTDASGTIASYNFDTTSTTVADTSTHLSSQMYNICFRRESGNCRICYFPHISTAPQSFGVSTAALPTVTANIETGCTTDWISIPEGHVLDPAVGPTATPPSGLNRFCGRALATSNPATTAVTVCSVVTPFILGVNFDADEVTTSTVASMANTNELQGIPAGTYGFWLDYVQTAC